MRYGSQTKAGTEAVIREYRGIRFGEMRLSATLRLHQSTSNQGGSVRIKRDSRPKYINWMLAMP